MPLYHLVLNKRTGELTMYPSRIRKIIDPYIKESYSKWDALISNENSDYKIIYPFSPYIEYCYRSLATKRILSLKASVSVCHEKIRELILNYFVSEIKNMAISVVVVELQSFNEKSKFINTKEEDKFLEFIKNISSKDNFDILMIKYKFLRMSIEESISQFIHFIKKLIFNLRYDLNKIRAILNHEETSVLIIDNILFIGDKHRNGERASLIKLKGGDKNIKLIYKPGNSSSIKSFSKIIEWINYNAKFRLKYPNTVFMKNHIWQEYIEYRECKTLADVQHFYYQLGSLLCIFYLLGSKDIHSENVIACGSDPYLVDYECLLSPIIIDNKSSYLRIRNLVSSTLILPVRIMGDTLYSGYDNSVIGNVSEQLLPFKKRDWLDVATTKMRASRVDATTKKHNNIPLLDGREQKASLFVSDFMDGFSTLYNFFLKNRAMLLNKELSPINVFNNILVRVILRPTTHYAQLLQESYHPLLLNDSSKRKNHFQFLKKTIKISPEYKNIIKSEMLDLNKQNIPIFFLKANKKLILNSRMLPTALACELSPLENMRNIIHQMDENDLNVQMAIIRNSFKSLTFNTNYKKITNNYNVTKDYNQSMMGQDIEEAILNIAKKIYKLKIKDGTYISWPTVDVFGSKVTGAITNFSLYDGSLGILFVLFIVGVTFEIQEYIELSITYVKNLVHDIGERRQSYNNVGMYCGLGGLIYVIKLMSMVTRFLSRDEIEKCIFSYDYIIKNNKESFDMMHGYSGFLNAILSVKDLISAETFSAYRNKCIHKLNNYDIVNDTNVALASYAHGVTGIYWTLLKDQIIIPSNKNQKLIKELLTQEKESFDIKNKAWFDLRSNKSLHFSHGWCHGSIGIGLTKLNMLSNGIEFEGVKEDLISSVSLLNSSNTEYDWSLCHGNLAVMDFICELEEQFSSSSTTKISNHLIFTLVDNIKSDTLSFYGDKDFFVPGLFNGLSGVLYLLLRYQFPGKIKSLLIT